MAQSNTIGLKQAVTLLPGSHRWRGVVNNAANDSAQILCGTLTAVTALALPLTSLIAFYDNRPAAGIITCAAGITSWVVSAAIMAHTKLPKPDVVIINSAQYNTIVR